MTCTVCAHPEREAVDEALVSGDSNRATASRYGLTRSSVDRHRKAHLSAALVKIQQQRESLRETSLADRLEANIARLEAILAASADVRAFVAANAEIRKTLELIGRLSGELRNEPTVAVVNIATAPEWITLRTAIMRALAPFPEAKIAVATALSGDDRRMIEARVVEQ